MKRLTPLLIIAAFFFAVCGSAGDRLHVKLKAFSSGRGCPQFSVLLPGDDFAGKPDVVEQVTTSGTSILFPELTGETFLSSNPSNLTIPDRYFFRGLGCGGLPS